MSQLQPNAWVSAEGGAHLCPKAQVEEALGLCGGVGTDLNHAAVLIAGDDVDPDAQNVCDGLHRALQAADESAR